MKTIFYHFRMVDENTDMRGSLVAEDGVIREVLPWDADFPGSNDKAAAYQRPDGGLFINGPGLLGSEDQDKFPLLMPALVDLHAHFREPPPGCSREASPETGFPQETGSPAETVDSASLAAAAGGYGTVVCMANTKPPIDTPEKAQALRDRAAALGLISLYPVLSLTKNMEGKELSGITALEPGSPVRMLSEDGRDVADDALFLAAMEEGRRLGIPVSCHCDAGGPEAEAAKAAGKPRAVWSRIEENNAVRRALELGKKAGCHIHIAHVSTRESAELIRRAKKESAGKSGGGFSLSCEATPHHIACTEEDARALGDESRGRVNPPLREEADRQAIIEAIRDGTIDAIATDHAPHGDADKARGAPGFTGLETAFGACLTELVLGGSSKLDLRRLSSLMSAAPARILGLGDRGRIAPGMRADLFIADAGEPGIVDPALFKSRGKNSPFAGRKLWGKILLTLHGGRIVFGGTVV